MIRTGIAKKGMRMSTLNKYWPTFEGPQVLHISYHVPSSSIQSGGEVKEGQYSSNGVNCEVQMLEV